MLYSSASTTRAFFDIHDAVVGLVEPAEVNGAVEDGPDVLGDLLEAGEVVFEQAGDEDLPALPSEGAISGDAAELEVSWILERPGPSCERPWGRRVEHGGSLHVQGLVGTVVVIDPPELVEAGLLGAEVGARR